MADDVKGSEIPMVMSLLSLTERQFTLKFYF